MALIGKWMTAMENTREAQSLDVSTNMSQNAFT